MKPIILGANVGAGSILAGQFVKKDGAGAVVANDTATSEIGIAESSQIVGNISYTGKIGVIKQGLVKVASTNATYNFGDTVKAAVGGQSVVAGAAADAIATVAETKTTTTADNLLLVYINLI
jgi:hypothetical protein